MPTHHASHFPLFRLQDYCTLVVSSSSLRFPSSRLSSDRSCLAELAASAISLASRSAENAEFFAVFPKISQIGQNFAEFPPNLNNFFRDFSKMQHFSEIPNYLAPIPPLTARKCQDDGRILASKLIFTYRPIACFSSRTSDDYL